MGRWEPDAQGRLRRAALDLFTERGFEQTTVADIAAGAGVTERTFFRYFADKKEVLFEGSQRLQEHAVAAIAEAPAALSPFETVARTVVVFGDLLPGLDYARQRAAAITANSDLQERELLKMSTLGAAMAAALRARGVAPSTSVLAAESGVTAFRVGFERWIGTDGADGAGRTDGADLNACIAAAVDELRTLTHTD
jgi:AcrR family transcriptional regulator